MVRYYRGVIACYLNNSLFRLKKFHLLEDGFCIMILFLNYNKGILHSNVFLSPTPLEFMHHYLMTQKFKKKKITLSSETRYPRKAPNDEEHPRRRLK